MYRHLQSNDLSKVSPKEYTNKTFGKQIKYIVPDIFNFFIGQIQQSIHTP
jgi:hypothetical protein